ncbi:MAG: DNA integrity scanning diadenylate cyclase DisA [Candidatus Hydrogenedentota bacterium]
MPRTKRRSEEEQFHDALHMLSPGSLIREAIAYSLQARTGALLCFGPQKRLADLAEGGIDIDTPTTSQLLYELCKMDGAILLSNDGTELYSANKFLKPRSTIGSLETGTRHRTAERMAKQAKCVVVAVSERRSSVTVFVGGRKHTLDTIPTLLNRAAQILQTLERFITALNQDMQDLSTREFQDMVTIFDVCRTLQRYERVRRIASEIAPYIIELGEEGRLVRMQLQELMTPVSDAELIILDYYRAKSKLNPNQIQNRLGELDSSDLATMGNISQLLGYSQNLRSVDTYLSSRGYRVLTQTNRLTKQIIENLVERFGTLQQIMRAPKEDLVEVDGVGEVLAERIRVGLNLLQNQLALERR